MKKRLTNPWTLLVLMMITLAWACGNGETKETTESTETTTEEVVTPAPAPAEVAPGDSTKPIDTTATNRPANRQ